MKTNLPVRGRMHKNSCRDGRLQRSNLQSLRVYRSQQHWQPLHPQPSCPSRLQPDPRLFRCSLPRGLRFPLPAPQSPLPLPRRPRSRRRLWLPEILPARWMGLLFRVLMTCSATSSTRPSDRELELSAFLITIRRLSRCFFLLHTSLRPFHSSPLGFRSSVPVHMTSQTQWIQSTTSLLFARNTTVVTGKDSHGGV